MVHPLIHGLQSTELWQIKHTIFLIKAVLAFFALGMTTLLAILDSSIVANAVSKMSDDLGDGDKSAWIGMNSLFKGEQLLFSRTCLGASYLITMSGFCCVSGRLGDIFGTQIDS